MSPNEKKIIVADDEPDIRRMVCECLGSVGYVTVEARDGAEVLKLLAKEHYDLVVLDIFMPVNGLQALEGIKANHPATKVVILSAITQYDANFKDAVIGKNAEAFVPKPPKLDFFLDTIGAVLEGREPPRNPSP